MSRPCGFAFDLVLLTVSGGKEGEMNCYTVLILEKKPIPHGKIIELITFKQTFHVGALDKIHSIHVESLIIFPQIC